MAKGDTSHLARSAGLLMVAKMGVTTGTLTVNVDRLEKQGLVARIPHETDRRSILVALTEAGRGLYREHHAHHLHLTRELQAALTPEETGQLESILRKLAQAL